MSLVAGQRRGAAPNMAGRRWGTGRPSDACALQPCHSRFITGRMQKDEELFAFLDDVYTSSPPGRTRTAYDALAEVLPRKAGIQLHTEKTRVWNAAGVRPVNLEDLGPDGIHEESKFWARQLVPRSSSRRCANVCNGRGSWWEAIPWVPDL